jgi:hypothetical protein
MALLVVFLTNTLNLNEQIRMDRAFVAFRCRPAKARPQTLGSNALSFKRPPNPSNLILVSLF